MKKANVLCLSLSFFLVFFGVWEHKRNVRDPQTFAADEFHEFHYVSRELVFITRAEHA